VLVTLCSTFMLQSYSDSYYEALSHPERQFALKHYDMFVGKSDGQLWSEYLGLRDEIDETSPVIDDVAEAGLPDSFNWQTAQPECVGAVRSQLNCGSCWAFSATSALADRSCLALRKSGIVLSPEDMVVCDTKSHGCNGG